MGKECICIYLSETPSLNCKIFQLKNEEEEDEERKSSRVSQERQKTLDRLRSFKQVNLLLWSASITLISPSLINSCSRVCVCLAAAVPRSGDPQVHSPALPHPKERPRTEHGNEQCE